MLADIIRRSLLLTGEHKQTLLPMLPSLTKEQREQLERMLRGEKELLQHNVEKEIQSAAENGDSAFLATLDAFVLQANTRLWKAEEVAEKGDDESKLDTFFDAV